MKAKSAWIAAAVVVLCAAIVTTVWLTRRDREMPDASGGADVSTSASTAGDATDSTGTSATSPSAFAPGYRPAITRATGTKTTQTTAGDGTDATTANEGTDGTAGDLVLSDGALRLESVGAYTGDFVEDGTNDAVADTAALLVTNTSARMLQMAEITFQVNAAEQARFVLTDIPAGATVLALEQNRRAYSAADAYAYGRAATAYTDAGMPTEDAFVLDTATAGQLAIENRSGTDYARLYVYYKYVQADGVYLGGITFRVPFDHLEDGARGESVASHFDPAVSRIVAVTAE